MEALMPDQLNMTGTYHYFCVVHNGDVFLGTNQRAVDDLCMNHLKAYSQGKDPKAVFIFGYGKVSRDDGDKVKIEEIQVLASQNSDVRHLISDTYHKGWIALGERVAKAKLKGFKKPVRKRGSMVMY